jgi:hypothetical protein
MKKNRDRISKLVSGFSFVEIIIAVAITALVFNVVSKFAVDVFSLNSVISGNLNTQLDARHVVKVMVAELRKTSPSSLGSYPLVLAGSTAVTFYSDIDNDGLKDRVRYFIDGKLLKKGVVMPTGSPLSYDDGSEKISTLMSGVVSSSTQPIFQYYSSSYYGTGVALSQPVNVSNVRLIKITVMIDIDPNRSPIPFAVISSVAMRNLKDNL